MKNEHIRLEHSVIGAVVQNGGAIHQNGPTAINYGKDMMVNQGGTMTIHQGGTPKDSSENQDIMNELKNIQEKLADQPLIAEAIADLRQAIENKDEATKEKKIKSLSSGVASSILKTLASESVKKFLHLS